jgi:hypothetical protein
MPKKVSTLIAQLQFNIKSPGAIASKARKFLSQCVIPSNTVDSFKRRSIATGLGFIFFSWLNTAWGKDMRGIVLLGKADIDEALPKSTQIITLSGDQTTHVSMVVSLPPNVLYHLKDDVQHDIYVLKGDIHEEGKDFGVGTYLSRTGSRILKSGPHGSKLFAYYGPITPYSENITVKPADQEWGIGGVPGMEVTRLRDFDHHVILVSWAPGTKVRFHDHPRGEEIFVLEGAIHDDRGVAEKGYWQRLYPDTGHSPYAKEKTLIILRNGHLV